MRTSPRSAELEAGIALPVTIDRLRDRVDCLPTLASWMYSEWYDALGCSLEDAMQTLTNRLNGYAIPLTLVAIEGRALWE